MTTSNPSEIKAALERILSSKAFIHSNVLSNFLRYVVNVTIEDKPYEIKEYTIAVNALGKPADFNPQLDAVIRIHAGRLRRSMHEYYLGEGSNDPLIISLEKGSYIPEFTAKVDMTNGSIVPAPVVGVPAKKPVNTIAVLPFKNLSGLPENDFIVDGFCEQLSSDLAQFPEIAVIAYFSTAKFREEKQDIRNVGNKLNAGHLITGSIYRDKKHLRISMQLVNAKTGIQLWTQTYQRTLTSNYLFDIFDDIIKQVVPKLTGYYGLISRSIVLSSQLDPLMDQDTIDAVFWYYHYQVRYTEEIFQITRCRIEKALQKNPAYALGWAILAQLYIDGNALGYNTVNDSLQEANRCIQKALQIDPDCQHAYFSLTWMNIFLRDRNNAIKSLERCISINPRSSFFLGGACCLFSMLGEYDKSIEYFKQSKTLNPYHSWWINLGPVFTYFHDGNYGEALVYANLISIPGVMWDHVFKIAALGQLSRIEEAKDLVDKFQVQFPGKTDMAFSALKAILFQDVVVYDRIKEGLYKAGLVA